ncbi:SlyX family protein [Rhodobacteraceae bacterium]|nr:SlyX family protein [Paracoccaceae bacterium]
MTSTTAFEEQLAHLTRVVDDLSDVIARQDGEITRLTKRLDLIMQREAEREYASGDQVPLSDQRPPHW